MQATPSLKSNVRRSLLVCGAVLVSALPFAASCAPADQSMDSVLAGSWRSDANRARDVFRHPKQTLEFFGVKPSSSVIEITPGGGVWYGEILAPYLKQSGRYIAANVDAGKAPESAKAYYGRTQDAQAKKFAADPERFGKAEVIAFDAAAPKFGPANSVDVVLTFRNVHNWVGAHTEALMFKAMFEALKPGGVLGVVDHRAAATVLDEKLLATGYLPEDYVIGLAKAAGFQLDAKSEVNANAKDTKDHPQGVWTLPPTYALGDKDRAKYAAIGESDRFTLRFVKPK